MDYNDESYNQPSTISFDEFLFYNNRYQENLREYVSVTLKTYILIFDKKFSKLSEFPECYAMAQKIGFGMLIRHSLEAMAFCLAAKNNIEVNNDTTVNNVLNELKNGGCLSSNPEAINILFDALNSTNSLAHPHISTISSITFNDLNEFYNKKFKALLEEHIDEIESITIKRLTPFNSVNAFGKRTNKYIIALKEQLDNFDISNRITCTLTKGCLIRHLTECAVNYWSFKNRICPTDESTAENVISIGSNLNSLSQIVKSSHKDTSKTGGLTMNSLNNLFSLKNSSNCLMHMDSCSIKGIIKAEKLITSMHTIILAEYSPDNFDGKFDDPIILNHINHFRPSLITTLLCGIGGWFGLHHFYTGHYVRGVLFFLGTSCSFLSTTHLFNPLLNYLYSINSTIGFCLNFLLVCGLLWSPFFSFLALINLKSGEFNSKWGKLPKTAEANILSVVFMILHVVSFFVLRSL